MNFGAHLHHVTGLLLKTIALMSLHTHPPQPFAFHGRGKDYFKIWIVSLALTIATLGIYAAWAKVKTRRYFYQCTELDGKRFEYHAKPVAILKGNLLVMAVVASYALGGALFPALGALVFVIVLALLPVFVVLGLRFHLAHCSYANLRFAFTGTVKSAYASLGKAILIALATGLAVLTTLGFSGFMGALINAQEPGLLSIALGFMVLFVATVTVLTAFTRGLRLFIFNHVQYGSASLNTQVSFERFNRVALITYFVGGLLAAVIMAAGVIASTHALDASFRDLQQALPASNLDDKQHPDTPSESPVDPTWEEPGQARPQMGFSPLVMTLYLFVFLFYFLIFAVLAYLKTAINNLLWNNTELEGGHRFSSQAKPLRATWIHISNWVLIILTLGLYLPFARIRAIRYRIKNMAFKPAGSIDHIVQTQQAKQKAYGDSMGDTLGLDLGL